MDSTKSLIYDSNLHPRYVPKINPNNKYIIKYYYKENWESQTPERPSSSN